jgi:hypothetical protein
MVIAAVAPAGMASASPIRHHHHPASGSSNPNPALAAWQSFLHGGPMLWARVNSPQIGTQIHDLMHKGLKASDPISNLNVDYLMWRRSLDPVRFDHFHPKVGHALQTMLTPTSTNPGSTVAPEQIVPPTSPTTPPTPSSSTQAVSAQSTSPSPSSSGPQDTVTPPVTRAPAAESVPEPCGLTGTLLLIGAGVWWRSRASNALVAKPSA